MGLGWGTGNPCGIPEHTSTKGVGVTVFPGYNEPKKEGERERRKGRREEGKGREGEGREGRRKEGRKKLTQFAMVNIERNNR